MLMYLILIHSECCLLRYTNNYTLTENLVLFYVIFKDLNRPTRRHIRQLVGNFWSAVLVQKNP